MYESYEHKLYVIPSQNLFLALKGRHMFIALLCKSWFVTVETTRVTGKSLKLGLALHKYEGSVPDYRYF